MISFVTPAIEVLNYIGKCYQYVNFAVFVVLIVICICFRTSIEVECRGLDQ